MVPSIVYFRCARLLFRILRLNPHPNAETRIAKFEKRWVFMLGFGLPLSALSTICALYFDEPLVGSAIYAASFPFVMILAMLSEEGTTRFGRLRMFYAVKLATNATLVYGAKLLERRRGVGDSKKRA